MKIVPGPLNVLAENQLPDGSRILIDRNNETVFALNATAGAAWDACAAPTTLCDVTKQMQRSLGTEITEELAEETVLQLEQKNLVMLSAQARQTTRREVLSTLGKVAVPLVVAMSLTEQRAHAQAAKSGSPVHVPRPEPVLPGPTKHCGIICEIFGGE